MKAYLGIDTSCYTTSVALLSETGELVAAKRQILQVKEGGRGLAQSEMLYQHTRNLPVLMEELAKTADAVEFAAIGVSSRPRPLETSYMPAFLAGLGLARSLGAMLARPVLTISHQENHLEAGLWSAGGPCSGPFLMFHVSGGTTDLLLAQTDAASGRWRLEQLGGSRDLHAGQMIDRIGVALGLHFPAGPALEALAGDMKPTVLPVSVQGSWCSLSGPLSAAERLLAKEGATKEALAAGVLRVVAESIVRMAKKAAEDTGIRQFLLVGGVMANRQIRQAVLVAAERYGWKIWFAEAGYSSDHAVGCAAAVRRWAQGDGYGGISGQ